MNEHQRVIIYGAGETGISIAEWLLQDYSDLYTLSGFIDDNRKKHKYPVPILGDSRELKHIKEDGLDNLILGFVYPVKERLRKGLELLDEGFHFPSLYEQGLDKKWGVSLGQGVLIYHASVNPNVKFGNFVGINAYSDVEASEIGDGVIITPQVFIGAGSSIGKGTIVYPGATILPNIKIGEFCEIGPNTVVHKDIESGRKYIRYNHKKD